MKAKAFTLALLLCACKGTDALPDEFKVEATHGESTFDNTARTGMDTDALTVGWTWHIGDVAEREREDGYHAALLAALTRVPIASDPAPVHVEPSVEHEAKPAPTEPAREPEDPVRFWPTATALAMAIATIVIKSKT